MTSLRDLIASNEDWLVQRVLSYAKLHGFTTFTSTLEVPWRESVCGFSRPLLRLLEETDAPLEISCRPIHHNTPIMAFAVEEARLHRQRGVPLGLYLGLIKYYRQAYLDLVEEWTVDPEERKRHRLQIDRFFDNIEISSCQEWTEKSPDDPVSEYAEKLRLLINEKNKYLTIFESLEEPVVLIDDDGRVENMNHAALTLFEDTALPGAGYYAPGDTLSLERQIAPLLAGAEMADGVERSLDTATGPREFRIRIQRMLDVSEKFLGTVVILSDITDYKRAVRAADAANRAKSAFLATMSHEIRTPITGILGIGRLLQGARLDAREARYVAALLSSGAILRDLVNDVLDYTKLETDSVAVEPVRFCPRELMARVADLAGVELESKGLGFRVDIDPGVPEEIIGDRRKIQRILLNLVGNAVKFTPDGSVAISLAPTGAGLRFVVTDTGPGIPEALQERIFAPFVQFPGPETSHPPGTGLGLAICRKLAQALGGDIGVDSAEGRGSRFWFECPSPIPAAQAGESVRAEPVLPAAQPLEMLLVEDNAVNALVIEGFLERDGHRSTTVQSGEEALDALAAKRFDMVLMDIRMHGIGGLEAIRHIRAHSDPATAGVPVLVVTADFANVSERSLLDQEVDAVLEKPFGPEELRRAVARALRGDAHLHPGRGRAGDEPVLDPAIIEAHRTAVGSARTARIVAAFLAAAPAQAGAARAATTADDPGALSDIAHVLKSSAEMVGLKRLGRVAAQTEALAGRADPAALPELAGTLAAEIETAVAALEALERGAGAAD